MERTLSPAALDAMRAANTPMILIDVRKAAARREDAVAIPGATWHDPAFMERWIAEFDGHEEIILYCAHGESISNAVVDALHARGLAARFVEGGLDGWRSAGGRVVPVDTSHQPDRS